MVKLVNQFLVLYLVCVRFYPPSEPNLLFRICLKCYLAAGEGGFSRERKKLPQPASPCLIIKKGTRASGQNSFGNFFSSQSLLQQQEFHLTDVSNQLLLFRRVGVILFPGTTNLSKTKKKKKTIIQKYQRYQTAAHVPKIESQKPQKCICNVRYLLFHEIAAWLSTIMKSCGNQITYFYIQNIYTICRLFQSFKFAWGKKLNTRGKKITHVGRKGNLFLSFLFPFPHQVSPLHCYFHSCQNRKTKNLFDVTMKGYKFVFNQL